MSAIISVNTFTALPLPFFVVETDVYSDEVELLTELEVELGCV